MIDLLERVALRFEREESPPHKARKLEGFVVQYGLPLAETVPLLPIWLSLPPPADYAPSTIPPEQQKQQTPAHPADRSFYASPPSSPCSLFMEDLHWVDPTTLECSDSWWIKVLPPVSCPVYLSARLQSALDRAGTPHPGHGASVAPASGCRGDPPGGARQVYLPRSSSRSWPRRMGCRCLSRN